jgi:tRNA wybutosine-synthesizing protein 1
MIQRTIKRTRKQSAGKELPEMVTPAVKEELEHQQYRIVGSHSAVKICSWTKSMINGHGGCYKQKFYGINSSQCLQMTTSLSCANRCLFCWRGYKAPVAKDWKWKIDDPEEIIEGSIKAHHQLLVGFGGSAKKDEKVFKEAKQVRHAALSLTGEPIAYPRINELIRSLHKRKISTFVVTNGQYPEKIAELIPVTQLYLSVDAPNKEMLKKLDVPLFSDHWERMLLSLDHLRKKKHRTAVRLTIVKGYNDTDIKGYAELINRGMPDFIEVKSYMFVGESRKRLKKENMPLHEEIVAFSKNLASVLEDYEIVSEHIPSRVVLLANRKFKKDGGWRTWIDFGKTFTKYGSLSSASKSMIKTPETGLSGKGTLDFMPLKKKEEFLSSGFKRMMDVLKKNDQ